MNKYRDQYSLEQIEPWISIYGLLGYHSLQQTEDRERSSGTKADDLRIIFFLESNFNTIGVIKLKIASVSIVLRGCIPACLKDDFLSIAD